MSTYCDYIRDHIEEELDEAFTEPEVKDIRRRVGEIVEEQVVRIENLHSEVEYGRDSIRFLQDSRDLNPLQEDLLSLRKDKLVLEQTLQTTQSEMKRIQAEQDARVATETNYCDRVAGLTYRQKERTLKAEFEERLEDLERRHKSSKHQLVREHNEEMKASIDKLRRQHEDAMEMSMDRLRREHEEALKSAIDKVRLEHEDEIKAIVARQSSSSGDNTAKFDPACFHTKASPITRRNSCPSVMTSVSISILSYRMEVDVASDQALPRASSAIYSGASSETHSDYPESMYGHTGPVLASTLHQRNGDLAQVERTKKRRVTTWVGWQTMNWMD